MNGDETWPALARVQCAAITTGCLSFLIFPVSQNVDIEHLDRAVPEDRRADDLLRMNGWRLDHGRWVCGLHSPVRPATPMFRRHLERVHGRPRIQNWQ